MYTHRQLTTLATALALAATFVACGTTVHRDNPDHCGNNEGDAYRAQMYPDKPY